MPQFASSVARVAQVPVQLVCPAPQAVTQLPPLQTWPAAHWRPLSRAEAMRANPFYTSRLPADAHLYACDRLGADGRYRWHWDPALMSDKRPGTTQNPERQEAAARRLAVPTLLVRGRMSDLLSEEGARAFLALVPHARYADVSGAGHMVAGDRNDAFTRAVVEFLADVT